MAGRIDSLGKADDEYYQLVRMLLWDGTQVVNAKGDSQGRLVLAYEGDLTVSMGDVEKGVTGTYWGDKRMEYTGINLTYEGFHITNKVATSDAGWHVWKYTWDGNGLCTRKQGPVVGAWDDRATAGWWA